MKKVLIIISLLAATFAYALTAEAMIYSSTYLSAHGYNADNGKIYTSSSWGGYYHLTITWNNTVVTVSAVEQYPDGSPNIYYWGNILSGSYPYSQIMDLYFSSDGSTWYYYGRYYYY